MNMPDRKCVLGARYNFNIDCAPIVATSPEGRKLIQLFKEKIIGSPDRLVSVSSLCGTSAQKDALLLAARDRYGFPVNTWLSKRSGLLWTSPIMDAGLLREFYGGVFQGIYRGVDDEISKRFATQILRSYELLGILQKEQFRIEGARVLDVGCGAGGMLIPFRDHGAKVLGCDIGGEEYLRYGRKLGLDLRGQAVDTLDGKFDIILVIHVLEHIPQPIEFLRMLRAKLSADGLIIIQVPGTLDLSIKGFDFLRFLQNSHLHHFTARTLTEVCRNAGLKVNYSSERVNVVAAHGNGDCSGGWDAHEAMRVLHYLRRAEYMRRGFNLARASKRAVNSLLKGRP